MTTLIRFMPVIAPTVISLISMVAMGTGMYYQIEHSIATLARDAIRQEQKTKNVEAESKRYRKDFKELDKEFDRIDKRLSNVESDIRVMQVRFMYKSELLDSINQKVYE